jgi:hypothetical protein
MPNFEDSIYTRLEEIERRLRVQENAARAGLNRAKFAWSTLDATATTFGTYYAGPAGATWAASDGTTGTGYPKVTLNLNTKALFFAQHTMGGVANDVTFRVFSWFSGIELTPPGGGAVSSWPATRPRMLVNMTHGPTTEGNPTTQVIVGRADLTPGSYTVGLSTSLIDSNPAAANLPTVQFPFVMVIPLD